MGSSSWYDNVKSRVVGNYRSTSELAKLYTEETKQDLKERSAAMLAETTEAGNRDSANCKTRMIALRRPHGTTSSSRRVLEKVSTAFRTSSIASFTFLLVILGRVDMSLRWFSLPSPTYLQVDEGTYITWSGQNLTWTPQEPTAVLINTLARLFWRYLSVCKVPNWWKTGRTVLLYKKKDLHNIINYLPFCLRLKTFKTTTRVERSV